MSGCIPEPVLILGISLHTTQTEGFKHCKSYLKIENKSAAGMQHTPSWGFFNAKKIILKLDLFMQV